MKEELTRFLYVTIGLIFVSLLFVANNKLDQIQNEKTNKIIAETSYQAGLSDATFFFHCYLDSGYDANYYDLCQDESILRGCSREISKYFNICQTVSKKTEEKFDYYESIPDFDWVPNELRVKE